MRNIEIKARCEDLGRIRQILQEQKARAVGEDHQMDTYFNVPNGRLKLREGDIENALIFYLRPDAPEPSASNVLLYHPRPDSTLKAILTQALGVKVIVDKQREIYFIDNVKFHLDRVAELGTFVEIEAIDEHGTIGEQILLAQCQRYLQMFALPEEALVSVSYSDLLLRLP